VIKAAKRMTAVDEYCADDGKATAEKGADLNE